MLQDVPIAALPPIVIVVTATEHEWRTAGRFRAGFHGRLVRCDVSTAAETIAEVLEELQQSQRRCA